MLNKTKILAAAVAMLLTTSAMAQTNMDHSAHGGVSTMADYMAPMDTMMESMNGMMSSGNADADFLLMMIPHHQSAIDMAKVELEHGEDQETRDMAEQIIAAQEQEIAEMKSMLERLGVQYAE